MSSTRRSYSETFKRAAVERYALGMASMAQIERELDITPGLLGNWRKQYLPEFVVVIGAAGASDGLEAAPDPVAAEPGPVAIWTEPPIEEPFWVQYYGNTVFATPEIYPNSHGIHTGIDWGKFDGAFSNNQQHLVLARCEGVVTRADSNPSAYKPGRVDIKPDAFPQFTLIYGHLVNLRVSVGDRVSSDTPLGALDATPRNRHVHVEIRRRQDNAYINPNPFLGPELKSRLDRMANKFNGTKYDSGVDATPASGQYKT